MDRKQMGYCHICGTYGKLTFEHIPPESALNKGRAKVYTGDDAIKQYTGEKSRYLSLQQGMGKYSLCESCNNNTGARSEERRVGKECILEPGMQLCIAMLQKKLRMTCKEYRH